MVVAVCAVTAGARSFVAIAEWAADLPVEATAKLGITAAPASESADFAEALDPARPRRQPARRRNARTPAATPLARPRSSSESTGRVSF